MSRRRSSTSTAATPTPARPSACTAGAPGRTSCSPASSRSPSVTASGTASGASGRGLRLLVRLACARPLVTVLLGVLGAVAALTYTVRQLGFVTSGRDLLPHGQPFVQREQEYSDDFPRLDQLVVAVEA